MIAEAQSKARTALGQPGDWLTGAQRRAAWIEVRDAASNTLDAERRASLSLLESGEQHRPSELLPQAGVEVVHRVATDPGRLTRSWADTQISQLGAALFTEFVGITAIATVLDFFDIAMTGAAGVLPEILVGEPARQVPDNVGEVGAWVPQTLGAARANVSRTLSGVPETNRIWRDLVDSHYSRGAEFMSLEWDRPLSRPQVELVAARVTSLNECFY
jgi:hypothetical protein